MTTPAPERGEPSPEAMEAARVYLGHDVGVEELRRRVDAAIPGYKPSRRADLREVEELANLLDAFASRPPAAGDIERAAAYAGAREALLMVGFDTKIADGTDRFKDIVANAGERAIRALSPVAAASVPPAPSPGAKEAKSPAPQGQPKGGDDSRCPSRSTDSTGPSNASPAPADSAGPPSPAGGEAVRVEEIAAHIRAAVGGFIVGGREGEANDAIDAVSAVLAHLAPPPAPAATCQTCGSDDPEVRESAKIHGDFLSPCDNDPFHAPAPPPTSTGEQEFDEAKEREGLRIAFDEEAVLFRSWTNALEAKDFDLASNNLLLLSQRVQASLARARLARR